MPVPRKMELTKRIEEARAKQRQSFTKRYRTPDQIARLAYHSTLIEGREVSHEHLRDAACVLLKGRSG